MTSGATRSMTSHDRLDDTEYIGKNWCPTCDPDKDPITEPLNILWCSSHEPARVGLDDERVTHSGYLSGSAEAGGEENAAWCNRIHRSVDSAIVVPDIPSQDMAAGDGLGLLDGS